MSQGDGWACGGVSGRIGWRMWWWLWDDHQQRMPDCDETSLDPKSGYKMS